MNNSKNYNSIVFLTTLSVYLGLVLVGSAPPVMAQAALTQKIEIQNEIEIEDDLDKNPDDLLVSSIIDIIKKLNRFSDQGIFDWNAKNTYQVESFSFCQSDNLPSFMGGGSFDNQQIYKELDNSVIALARKLFNKETDFGLGDFPSHGLELSLISENKTLNLKVEVKNGNGNSAKIFADDLIHYLTRLSQNYISTKKKIVAENTKITFENNQISIVTNLPRASIDLLLAETHAK